MKERRTKIMGVINVTPDSFSDGGDYQDTEAATQRAYELVSAGADIIDIGGESTRPGALEVPLAAEWERIAPVLLHFSRNKLSVPVSVDSRKPEIMLRAADLGVGMINHVVTSEFSAEWAGTHAKLAAYPDLHYVAMHAHGEPRAMQAAPLSENHAVVTVERFFAQAYSSLRAAGFPPERIWLDPGIGFGKTDAANLQLMRHIKEWAPRYQIAVGVSRKSLLGRLLKNADEPAAVPPKARDTPTKMLELGLAMLGAKLLRTHEVPRLKVLLDLLDVGATPDLAPGNAQRDS